MRRVLSRAVRRFLGAEDGNIFLLFGLSVIPILVLMGGAVDLSRYNHYKMQLSNAVDAAALALVRQDADYTEAEATAFVNDYIDNFDISDETFTVGDLVVEKTDKGYIVDAQGQLRNLFLPIAELKSVEKKMSTTDVNILSEVVHSTNRVELAMVFDNTGSMDYSAGSNSCDGNKTRMAGLQCAAKLLVEELLKDDNDPDMVKIGLVPFEGSVNIVNSEYKSSWVDLSTNSTADSAKAAFNGRNVDAYGGKRVTGKDLYDLLAANASYKFSGTTTSAANGWYGCVEMRAEPYDVTDTPPSAATPNTLFVPHFWPDEPDSSSTVGRYGSTRNNSDGDSYYNDYLNDKMTSSSPATVQKSLTKYGSVSFHSGRKDTSWPFEYGPNRGCPKPIVPLTNVKATLLSEIAAMQPMAHTGTFIVPGLFWGWSLLSPGEPFTSNVHPGDEEYENTVKAIVLLTDGENSVTGMSNHNKSTYSAYNYIGLSSPSYRLGSSNSSTAQANLDAKTATLCTNVKDDKVRIYAITFGDGIAESAKTLMKNCASVKNGQSLYYHAPSSDELKEIFYEIGQDLTDVHIAM